MGKLKGIKLQRGQKILLIFTAAFVLAAVIFAVVFGAMMMARRAMAAVRYESVNMDEKTAAYLASYNKLVFMGKLNASGIESSDDVNFWSSLNENGVTYGQLLVTSTANYLSDIVIANYHFDRYAKLTDEQEEKIRSEVEAIFSKFDSKSLDEVLAASGTDRNGVARGVEMINKAKLAKSAIYGEGGVNLANYPDECEKYLQEYSRVKILLINKEKTFRLDENGKRVVGNDGNYEMRDLTENEKLQRAELIAEIDGLISGYENGGNLQMREDIFEDYIERYGEWELDKTESGYYFSEYSAYKAAFATNVSADVADAALEMEEESYKKVETDSGIWYLYRCPVQSGAYADTSEDGFFADFYSDAADFLYSDLLRTLREDVEFTGKIDDKDIVYNACQYKLYMTYLS